MQESLKDMRMLVEELEATKRALLKETAGASPRSPSCGFLGDKENARANAYASPPANYNVAPRSVSTLSPSKIEREDFVQLTEQIERLRLENAAIARELRERDLFNSAMQHLLLDFRDGSDGEEHRRQRELVGFTPLSHDEVRSAVDQALQQCRAARLAHDSKSRHQSVGTCFGWTDFRVRTGATITFSVKKRFAGLHRPDVLRDSMWDIATDSSRITGLLPSGLKCDLRVLQRVSDNVLVIDRRTYNAGAVGGVALRTVLMIFRLRDADGSEVVVMKTMDAPLVKETLLPDELWCDIFYWMRFEAGGGAASSVTRSEFGGVLTYVREDIASAWIAELLFLAIRWETLAVRSVLLTAG